MTLIHVRCSCGTCQEWVLIELQGEIERSDGEAVLDGLDVGTLCKAASGVLTLTVGYHEVEGKLAALKKPLVVLRRVDEADGAAGPASYEAVGVIRKKFNFKTRPKALISAAEPGKRMKTAQNAALRSFFGTAAQQQ